MSSIEISFLGSLSDTSTAISIGGDGATRIRFDVPESELASVIKMVLLKGKLLKIKIIEVPDDNQYLKSSELINE